MYVESNNDMGAGATKAFDEELHSSTTLPDTLVRRPQYKDDVRFTLPAYQQWHREMRVGTCTFDEALALSTVDEVVVLA
jgi:hypothetical protein